jgi:hypothetical protein
MRTTPCGQGRSGGENDPGKNSTIPSPNTDDQEVSSFSANRSFGRGTPGRVAPRTPNRGPV